jgi:hypothetical protein
MKLIRIVLVATAALGAAGCGDIHLDAPRGARVRLLGEKSPARVRAEQVVWFKYWGNEPFAEAETHAATLIDHYRLREARISMVNTFADGFISTFTGPLGFPRRTLVVEGNPAPDSRSPAQSHRAVQADIGRAGSH